MRKPLRRKILKLFISLSILIFGTSLILFFYFYIKKDQIAGQILLNANKEINGELSFDNISIHPFVQFPSISLAFENLAFFEKQDTARSVLDEPLAEFERVYVAFDLQDLLYDKITITKVLFKSGYVDIIKHPDRKFNFELALAKPKKTGSEKGVKKEKKKPVRKKTGKRSKKKPKDRLPAISKTLRLKLDEITARDIYLEYNNQRNGKQSSFQIDKLEASLSIMPGSITTSITTETKIKQLDISKAIDFKNIDTRLETELRIDRGDSVLYVLPSKLKLSRADFLIDGLVDIKNEGIIDLNLDATDSKLGFLNLLLSKSGIENLTSGNFFFDGSIKGSFADEIPELKIDFGIRNLSLRVPETNDSIKGMQLSGNFSSGKQEDLTEAILKLDTLNAQLPNGFIDGVFEIKNLTEPRIKYKLDLKTELAGLLNAFKLHLVDSLKGNIELHDEFKGVFYPGKGWVDEKRGNLRLKLDSLSFSIPEVVKVAFLGGEVTDKYKKIQFKNIKINTGGCDLSINGSIKNFPNLFFDEGKQIIANLLIRSKILDIKDTSVFSASIRNSFPYKIKNLDLKLLAKATKEDLVGQKKIPKINFRISRLNFSIDSLFKPLKINKGQVLLSGYKEWTRLNFKNFNIKAGQSNLLINYKYLIGKQNVASNNVTVKIKRLNLLDLLHESLLSSSLTKQKAMFDAQTNCRFTILSGENSFVKDFKLKIDDFKYKGKKDKANINSLTLKAKKFSISNDKAANIFETLSGKFALNIEKLHTKDFQFEDIVYSINAKKGNFTIVPKNDSILGVKANGKFVFLPFENPPAYSFYYYMQQFSAGRLFANFLKDSAMTGEMDFEINLRFNGNSIDSMLANANGKIKLSGDSLTFYGVDVDQFLDEYQQTQNLNLLDIGLVFYAGPIGLLSPKSKRFAKVKITNRKKKSLITRLVSNWLIKSDSIIVEDVAFATPRNRLALKGWYSYNSDSLDFSIGALDEKGCSFISQRFTGPSNKPDTDNGAFLMPSFKEKSKKTKCIPFYKGSLKHPK